jgi:uncharacterized Zn-finger protein
MVASHFDNPARFDGGPCRLRLSSIAGVSVVIQVSLSLSKVNSMSDHVVPHFHNDAGVSVIEIGSQEFMCVGANPPFDHPHVFLDLGNDNEIICPYCSTLYRYAADLAAGEARPPECVLKDKVA